MTSRRLNDQEIGALIPYIPIADLECVTLHIGRVPWYLPKRFAAIALYNDVYLRSGVYDPHTPADIALLGHELTHVGQYRNGMTAIRYVCSTIRGYNNSRYEKAAFAVQAQILEDYSIGCGSPRSTSTSTKVP